MTALRRISESLLAQLLIALVLGILCGLFFGDKTSHVKWVGDAYVRLLQMTAIPYVVVALIHSLGQLNPQWARRIGLNGTAMMLLLWLISLGAFLCIPLAYPDWPSASFFSLESSAAGKPFDPLSLYIPSNVFSSLANSVIPAVVLFCIAFGVALIWNEEKMQLLGALGIIVQTLGRMAGYIAKFTPLAFLAITANAAGTMELTEFARLQIYLGTFLVAFLLFVFWIFPVLVAFATPFSYAGVLRNAQLAMVTAFAAGSVLVALPLISEACKRMLEEEKLAGKETLATVEVTMPVVYSLPKASTFISLAFVLFAAWFIGSPLSAGQYPGFAATGLASVFGGQIIATTFLLDFYGLPADLIDLFILAGAFTNNFEAALSAMHGMAFCLLAVSAVAGCLRWRRLLSALALGMGLTVVAFAAMHFVFASLIPFAYDADKTFLARRLLGNPVPTVLVTDPAPLGESARERSRLDVIRERGTLRVAYTSSDILPKVFVNADDDLVGLDVEIMHALARDLEVKLELVRVEKAEQVVEWLDSGRADLAVGVVLTPERARRVAFTRPYLTVHLGFAVADRDRHRFASLESIAELPSLTIASRPLEYYVRFARNRLPNARFVAVDSYRPFFEGATPEADAMLISAEVGTAWTFIFPQYSMVVPKGLDLQAPLGLVCSRNDSKWLMFVNSWLDLNESTGVIQRYHDYWVLGTRASAPEKRWSVIRDVLGWVE